MSQQGPIIVVSNAGRPAFASALDDAKIFPIIDTTCADAPRAVEQLAPAAIVVAMSETVEPGFEALAKQIAARQPYLPLIADRSPDVAARECHSFLARLATISIV